MNKNVIVPSERIERAIEENASLRSQSATLKKGRGQHRKFLVLFDAIRELMTPPERSKRRIGFASEEQRYDPV